MTTDRIPSGFRDRDEAGRFLAEHLVDYAGRDDVTVLALPRGGVPVAVPVARRLGAPLDVFLVRKLGVPGRPELAAGAIADGGATVFNPDVIAAARISQADLDAVAETERRELDRRSAAYRAGRPQLEVAGRTVIVVDDGVATGATMKVAVRALRDLGAARIVVAVPVGPPEVHRRFGEADEVVCPLTPTYFPGVGGAYRDFRQLSDDDVRRALGGR